MKRIAKLIIKIELLIDGTLSFLLELSFLERHISCISSSKNLDFIRKKKEFYV